MIPSRSSSSARPLSQSGLLPWSIWFLADEFLGTVPFDGTVNIAVHMYCLSQHWYGTFNAKVPVISHRTTPVYSFQLQALIYFSRLLSDRKAYIWQLMSLWFFRDISLWFFSDMSLCFFADMSLCFFVDMSLCFSRLQAPTSSSEYLYIARC